MDIDLLSKMVKELILDNDRVALPGFGAFVAEIVPSTFSDKGYTINPPYRKLYFRNADEDGMELIKFYASSNNVELAVADKIVRDFVAELKSVLFARKTVVFPGLGRLRATKENAVFFVADEDLDIYPEGFGLEPISLKTHVETQEEISEAVAGLKAIVTGAAVVPETEPAAEPVAEPEIETEAEPEPIEEPAASEEVIELEVIEEPIVSPVEELVLIPEEELVVLVEDEPIKKRSGWRAVWITLICLVAAAALFFGAFMALAYSAPELLDTILYTDEELEILNHI
jgi:nucleoid DNA-binding protein